jgi:hypothetical protein
MDAFADPEKQEAHRLAWQTQSDFPALSFPAGDQGNRGD